jgi:hypothetical protein
MRKTVLFYKDDVDTSTRVARSGSGERGLQICRGDEGTPEPLPNQDTDTTIPIHHFATTQGFLRMQNNKLKQPIYALVLAPTTPHMLAPLLSFCHYGCLSRRKQRASAQTGAKTNRQQLLGLTALLLLSLSTRTTASLCPALLASSASVPPLSRHHRHHARDCTYRPPARRNCLASQGQQNPALSLRRHHNTRLELTRCFRQVHLQTGQCVSSICPPTRRSSP